MGDGVGIRLKQKSEEKENCFLLPRASGGKVMVFYKSDEG